MRMTRGLSLVGFLIGLGVITSAVILHPRPIKPLEEQQWLAVPVIGIATIIFFLPWLLGIASDVTYTTNSLAINASPGMANSGTKANPWSALFSEPVGGLSLARVQFAIWSFPVVALYFAHSILHDGFSDLTPQVTILMGLTTATSVLSGAANPPLGTSQPNTDTRPAVKDLFEDWGSQSDLSRYQYFLLSVLGSLLLIGSFIKNLTFPAIPEQFLWLIGASQSAYFGTKAVKTSRSS